MDTGIGQFNGNEVANTIGESGREVELGKLVGGGQQWIAEISGLVNWIKELKRGTE